MKLGTVGTSWITNSFIEAARQSGKLTLSAVYSRSIDSARRLADTYNALSTFDKLEQMAQSENIDIVYIASPNSLHHEQAKLFLQHRKHVICEKPIFSNTREWDDAHRVADDNEVFLFEAMRNIHSPNSKILKQQLNKAGKLRSAILHYIQYSSRYDLFLKGEEPNIFSSEFSGGALVDLGVYPTSLAVSLFGAPLDISYYPVMLRSGVDGGGTLILKYEGFICTILCSKIAHSNIASEIHGEKGSFALDHVAPISKIEFIDSHSKDGFNIEVPQYENEMVYEIKEFTRIIQANDQQKYEELKKISRSVLSITESARKQNDIVFDVET